MRARYSTAIAVLLFFADAWITVEPGAMAAPGSADTSGVTSAMQNDAALTNTMCPVITDEPVDPDIFTEYEGTRIYFCCRRCLRQFERDPQKYIVNLASFSALGDAPDEKEGEPPGHVEAQTEGDTAAGQEHEEAETHEHGGSDDHAHAVDQEADAVEPIVSDHDHEHDRGSQLPAVLRWLGKFHPPAVNFPVGLLIAAALAELLLVITGRSFFASSARFCVWIGALGALSAATLGWLFGGIQLVDDNWIMTTHRWLGTSTAVLALAVLVLSESHHRRPGASARTRAYRVSLFLSVLLVSVTGFFGGAMVYGINHYAW